MRQQTYPLNRATPKQIPKITKTSFVVFLFLSKIIIPRPEFTSKPANKEPKDKVLDIYNSEIRMLEAQLGISPMIAEYKGVK